MEIKNKLNEIRLHIEYKPIKKNEANTKKNFNF